MAEKKATKKFGQKRDFKSEKKKIKDKRNNRFIIRKALLHLLLNRMVRYRQCQESLMLLYRYKCRSFIQTD